MTSILLIDNSPALTGAFKSVFQVAQALQKHYRFVFVIPVNSTNRKLLEQAGFTVISLSFLEIAKNPKVVFYLPILLYNAFKIKAIVKREGIGIVHVNDLYNLTGIMVKWLMPGLKLVYHVRLLPASYAGTLYPFWRQLILRYADRVIAVSEVVAQQFEDEKTTVIYDTLPRSYGDSAAGHSPNPEFTILYLANYIPGKGHRQALEAFARARPDMPPARQVFYGDTWQKKKNERFKQQLLNQAHHLGIADSVVFNDFAEDTAAVISRADLVLNFSESESFSMTTLEALACGTPVIVTDCGGPAEIVENGRSGLLVPVNDIAAMAAAIVRLAKEPTLRKKISRAGLQRVQKKFDPNEQNSRLNTLYKGLLLPGQ